MARSLAAVLAIMVIAAACGGSAASDAIATGEPAPTVQPSATVIPTALPTTAAVPAPTPTALALPSPVPTQVPPAATPAPSPTVVPTAVAAQPPAATAVPAAPTPGESQEILATNGGETYTIACARCHGANGTGSERYGGLLGVGNRYTSATMIAELTNGHAITFGFADTLSADEIAAVVAYVKATYP